MKTVLAPGAPWPTYEKPVEVKPPKKKKKVIARKPSKKQITDKNFELWLRKTP
jgi:hypothetical protein